MAFIASSSGMARADAAPGVEHPPVQLDDLPLEKIAAMGPLLRGGEVALIEAWKNGRMKQATVMALVAAPPEVVREAIGRPEKYGDVLKGISKLEVVQSPDGWCNYSYSVDLKVTELKSRERLRLRPDGCVEVKAQDATDHSLFRWIFVGVPGGTIIVQYGYMDILHSGPFVRKLVTSLPAAEHGFALAVQLALVRTVKEWAEAHAAAGSFAPFDVAAKSPGFKFLLERGRVAVVRSRPDGRLSDVAVMDTVYATKEKVAAVLTKPADYASFIDGTSKSRESGRDETGITYEAEFDFSLFSWSGRFAMRSNGTAVDVLGLSGDLRNARYRWDLTPRGAAETQVVYRANQDLAASSPLILGMLFKRAPVAEHGLALTLALMNVVGVRGRSEGWK